MLPAGVLLQGRYNILEPLNEGGMSLVYLAEDLVLGTRVAVKEMKDHFLSAQERTLAAEQFRKEAHILAHLEHPGVPRVTNFFEQDRRHYLVMDYIQGDTLETVINNHGGRLPEALVLTVGASVCRVLDYLHHITPAVIFRDLKPSNIMLTGAAGHAGSEKEHVKLIDFGISKIFDPTTGTRTIIRGAGTPGFAPPEQYGAHGRVRTDARSDIYSLGATMYHALTGQIPVEATDRWMNGVVLPPPRSFNQDLSAQTEQLILRMMELKPEDRPASARDVLDHITGVLALRGVAVRSQEPEATTKEPGAGGQEPEANREASEDPILHAAPEHPTVLGRTAKQRSSLGPVLGALGMIGVLVALLSTLHAIPFGPGVSSSGRLGTAGSGHSREASVESSSASSASSGTPRQTRIGVSCQPAGASVLIDGMRVATSTGSQTWIDVTSGTHEVKCVKSGYLTWRTRVQVAKHQNEALSADLVKEATLRITALPLGSHVLFDGKPAGRAPLTLRGLSKGIHAYTVSAQGRISRSGTIVLAAGEDLHVDIKLKAKPLRNVPRPVKAPAPPVYHPVPPATYRPPPVYHKPVYRPRPRVTPVDVPGPRATPR